MNRFKRQKVVSDITLDSPRWIGTNYEAPQESLINFPSSIVNGVTKEKGLISLTLKSIAGAKLIEQMTWMHGGLFANEEDPVRIIDHPVDLKQKLDSLKKEVEMLKQRDLSGNMTGQLSQDLSQAINNPDKLKEFEQVLRNEGVDNLTISNGNLYDIINAKEDIISAVKVDKASDVTPIESIIAAEPAVETIVESNAETASYSPVQQNTQMPSTTPETSTSLNENDVTETAVEVPAPPTASTNMSFPDLS